MLPMAHASDGFGSIRAPAACCGLVGLKPTRGRNTFAPVTGEGLGGCSTEHAVTLSVRDSAALLDATRGPGPGDPYAAPPPARPVPRGVRRAEPGRCASPTPRWPPTARRSTRRASPRSRRRCSSAPSSATTSRRPTRRSSARAVVPTFLTLAAVNTVVNLASHPTAGPARARGRGRDASPGHRQAGRAHQLGATTCAPPRPRTGSAARWPRSTPATTCC